MNDILRYFHVKSTEKKKNYKYGNNEKKMYKYKCGTVDYKYMGHSPDPYSKG